MQTDGKIIKQRYSQMKICIICQVKNSFEYIPAWLANHSSLADHIYLIDHNSNKDLRKLSGDKLTVFRTDSKVFEPDININALIAHKQIQNIYDWVFIIDIDEFLPFSSRIDIKAFCIKNRLFAGVSLYWKNGIAKNKKQTADIMHDTAFEFQTENSLTRKFCYNTKRRRHFWIGHGNHGARFPLFGIPFLNIRPLLKKGNESLFHIPFINMEILTQKFKDFPPNRFRNKMFQHADHLIEKHGEKWYQKKLNWNEILWLVANYREENKKKIIPNSHLKFEQKKIFKNLRNEIIFWRKRLDACPDPSLPMTKEQAEHENYAFSEIKKNKKYNYKWALMNHTHIDKKNMITFI